MTLKAIHLHGMILSITTELRDSVASWIDAQAHYSSAILQRCSRSIGFAGDNLSEDMNYADISPAY
jgi:hypothetical protein